MPTAIDKIVGGVLFPTIPPIVGTPTYNTIAEVHLKLKSNAASVQSNLGCGTLVLIQLTFSPAVYNTFSSITFIVPVNPGSDTIIPANCTGAQITELCYAFDTASALSNEYNRTKKALRNILLSTVDKISSAPSNTSTLDTASPPPAPSWITCTPPTSTSPPRIFRKTTLSFAPLTMLMNQSNQFLTGLKIAATTPPPATLRASSKN